MQIVTVALHDLDLLLDRKADKIITALTNNNKNSTSDEWLNIKQLCYYLPDKPARQTVYGWVSKRLIPYHKKGKSLSFLKSEIDQWLKEGLQVTVTQLEKKIAKETDSFVAKKRKEVCND